MRLVFLGSPPFANPVLARLIDSPYRPFLVITPPDRPRGRSRGSTVENELASLARANGIEVAQPKTVRSPEFLEELRGLEPELILVCAYGEYLDAELRDIPSFEILNVHPSLLPRHRGASPIQAAIRAGDRVTGVTIQRVVKEMDAGEVVVALSTDVGEDETAGELAERLAVLGGEASVQALEALSSGTAVFLSQDAAQVTTCSKLTVEDSRLDWTRSSSELLNLVRAMNPWPLARTLLPDGKELLVLRARIPEREEPGKVEPGTVVAAGLDLLVQTGTGTLELLEVKPAGKRAMPAGDYLRGASLEAGARFS